jgi:hypothetical protein
VGFLTSSRVWNIAARTLHIAAMGVLLGGHAYDVPWQRLVVPLWITIGTGVALAGLETGGRLLWFHQGRGLATMAKLVLIVLVPLFWQYRLPILLGVVAVASVGSHMSARFRYYSVLYGEIVRCGSGPGTKQLAAEELGDASGGRASSTQSCP